MNKVFFFIFCAFFSYSGFSQEVDSVLVIKKNQFLLDLANRDGYVHPLLTLKTGIVNPESPKLITRTRRLIKVGKALYLHFGASGKLYKMEDRGDSSLYFIRVDNSENYNYNCFSTFIVDNNEIFDYGGYGFWKSNGLFRRFNFIDREWDSYTVDAELTPSEDISSWYDPATRFLYLPYQEIVNEGLSKPDGKAEVLYDSYRMDFKKKHWEKLGKITKEAYSIFKSRGFTVTTDEGLIIILYGKSYWVDFTTNSIRLLVNSEQGQTLLRLTNNTAYYYSKDKIYYYDFGKNKCDSILLNRSLFSPTNIKIWEKPVTYKYYYYSLLLILIPLTVFFVRVRKKIKRSNTVSASAVEDAIIPFTETEIGLLELLLKKNEQNRTATVSEINYVLGIKDKNPGMQKKVRSGVINAINEKYVLYTQQKIQLVQSIRSELDKRFFEYLLNPDTVDDLVELIKL